MRYGGGLLQKKLEIVNIKYGIIILARLSSSRLPGKALRTIGNKKLIEHVIVRLLNVFEKETLVVATSTEDSDDILVEFVQTLGINTYRGSLNNVAKRFHDAAKFFQFDFAVRINGDNVLLDPFLVKEMLLKCMLTNANFMSNVKGRTFPKGMSIEIVKLDYFTENLSLIMKDSYFSEHVMAMFYGKENQVRHYYLYNYEYPEAIGIDLSLDDDNDVKRTEWMLKKLEDKIDIYSTIKTFKEYEKSL